VWGRAICGPLTNQAALADPANTITQIADAREWTRHEVAAPISDDCDVIGFGVFLAGRGRIEMRHPRLMRLA
jgi:hypothetical protein